MTESWQGFHGRRWDAPMTDDMQRVDLTGQTCSLCQEEITADDDGLLLGSIFHTECLLRSTLGDVAHIEGRCMCFGGGDHDEEGTYREQAQRALAALIAKGQGRWAEEVPTEPAVLSQWVIYAGPADYPGRFVVRQWDVVQGQKEPVPHEEVTVHFTIQSARNAIPPSADTCFPRSPGDGPSIVETWM